MRKTAAVLATVTVFIVIFALSAFASRSDFTISPDGTLTGYSGAGGSVIIPSDVTAIAPGVFTSGSVSSITVLNPDCSISEGAVAGGTTLYVFPYSVAEQSASEKGYSYELIYSTPSVKLTIKYVRQDGSEAASTVVRDITVYSAYDIPSPAVNGYTPDIERVKGSVEDYDVEVTVTYTKNADPTPPGWHIDGNHIRYYDASQGGFVASRTVYIDGADRTFDGNGYLVGNNNTVDVNGSTYYLINNVICYGAVRIGDGIFFFDESGKMVKGKDVGGNSYDSSGRLTKNGEIVNISDVQYYLQGNKLYSGFVIHNNGSETNIYYFGDDYAKKTNTVVDGCTFDASGKLSSVSADLLECEYETTRTYNKREQKPEVKVTLKGIQLIEGVHYTVDYADNIGPGDARIIITGMGPVKGEKELVFSIEGKETFTLTIRYQNSRGYEMSEPYTAELAPGEHYSVVSPDIKGYKPDKKKVEGNITDSDVTVIVTYLSGNEAGNAGETDGSDTASETDVETDSGKDGQDEQKTRLTYSYNYKLFFTVAGIATAAVAVTVFLIIWFSKKRRNPPTDPSEPDEGGEDGGPDLPEYPDDGVSLGDTITGLPIVGAGTKAPASENDEVVIEYGSETEAEAEAEAEADDGSRTMRFDLHEIEIDDFDENSASSDFADFYEPSVEDEITIEEIKKPKRYRFRFK